LANLKHLFVLVKQNWAKENYLPKQAIFFVIFLPNGHFDIVHNVTAAFVKY